MRFTRYQKGCATLLCPQDHDGDVVGQAEIDGKKVNVTRGALEAAVKKVGSAAAGNSAAVTGRNSNRASSSDSSKTKANEELEEQTAGFIVGAGKSASEMLMPHAAPVMWNLLGYDVERLGTAENAGGWAVDLIGLADGLTERKFAAKEGGTLLRKIAGCGCCFVKGAPVLTAQGLRPIEEVVVGDAVCSRDERTGQTALKHVTELIRHDGREMYALVVVSSAGTVSRIEVSDNHARCSAAYW